MIKASLSRRKINIVGAIDDELFCELEWALTAMEDAEPGKPIHITLCSDGGESAAGMACAERMLISPCEIHCDAYGEVASAAVGLFLAAKRRRMSKNCWFMHHEDSQEFDDKLSNIASTMVHLQIEESNWNALVASRTKRTESFWRNIGLSKDRYLNAEQCLKLGVIHAII